MGSDWKRMSLTWTICIWASRASFEATQSWCVHTRATGTPGTRCCSRSAKDGAEEMWEGGGDREKDCVRVLSLRKARRSEGEDGMHELEGQHAYLAIAAPSRAPRPSRP
eukprot:967780-Rhodomonas_salina.1